MNKKFKGQGALEYLLLIGGAVLIAVIVIALLVGMGGQSRDSAAAQAEKANQATDVPQPAQIVQVVAPYDDCNSVSLDANLTFSWRPLGEGGSHELLIKDSSNKDVNIQGVLANDGTTSILVDDLNPNEVNGLNVDLNIGSNNKCGDSYYLYIKTTKNNQTVTSQGYRFSWND
jgi:hypothetical protein